MEEGMNNNTSVETDSAPQSTPAQFDQHGVNPEWVKEMTTPPEAHETDVAPDSGRTTRTIPSDVPNPELIGQYDRENVLSYVKGASGQAYDFNAAFQSVMADPSTYAEFIQAVPAEHLPGLTDLAHNFIAHDPENVIRELVAMNHLPEWVLPQPSRVDASDPWLADLRPEMRAFVLDNVDPQMWDELLRLSPEARDRILQRDMELAQMKRREYEQRAETAVREWNWQMDDIEDGYREAYLEAVQTLQPFTEDAANEKAQDMCMLATWAQALNDPHLRNMREVAGEGFQLAAEERFKGNDKLAKGHEMNANRLMAEFNKELKAKLDANIKQFQLFFQHAPGRREAPAEQQQQYIH